MLNYQRVTRNVEHRALVASLRSTGLPALLILCPLCALLGAGTASNLGLLGFANVAKGGMAEAGEGSMKSRRVISDHLIYEDDP